MEPVSIIMAALAAGAAAGATEVASQAIKDAYEGLKALVLKRLEGKPAAENAPRTKAPHKAIMRLLGRWSDRCYNSPVSSLVGARRG